MNSFLTFNCKTRSSRGEWSFFDDRYLLIYVSKLPINSVCQLKMAPATLQNQEPVPPAIHKPNQTTYSMNL